MCRRHRRKYPINNTLKRSKTKITGCSVYMDTPKKKKKKKAILELYKIETKISK